MQADKHHSVAPQWTTNARHLLSVGAMLATAIAVVLTCSPTLHAQASLADAYFQQAYDAAEKGNYEKAIPLYKLAIKAATVAYGKHDCRVLNMIVNLADSYSRAKRYEEARTYFKQAYEASNRVRTKNEVDIAVRAAWGLCGTLIKSFSMATNSSSVIGSRGIIPPSSGNLFSISGFIIDPHLEPRLLSIPQFPRAARMTNTLVQVRWDELHRVASNVVR